MINTDTILKIIEFLFKWGFGLTMLIIFAVQLGAFSRDSSVQIEYCYHKASNGVQMCDDITLKFKNIPRGKERNEIELRHWMDSVGTEILKNATRLMENAK